MVDEFQQESTGLDRLHEGSGLGLAITRRLVELMLVELMLVELMEVESEKGCGSTFTVTFPRLAREKLTTAGATPPSRGCPAERRTSAASP